MTVALVYNVKEEALNDSPLTTARTTALSHPHSSSTALTSTSHPGSDFTATPRRVDDLFAEWDTMETVHAVRVALEERHRVVMVEANELAFEKLRTIRPSFVFNMSEGMHGVSREAQIPAMLEMLRLPYLGSDPLTLAVCLDKARAKEILTYHELPTPPFMVIRSMEDMISEWTRFPAMVKPLHEGSSKGIYNANVVHDGVALRREAHAILEAYHEPVLVEEFLPGREFTVALLGNGEGTRVLPIVEMLFDALPQGMNPIYSYEAKWIWDRAESPLKIFQCPANVDPGLRHEIETICKTAFQVLNCRDWARIDVRLDATGRPNIIEINPLPGILPKIEDNSCFPKAARAAGLSYNALINTVLDIGLERCSLASATRPLPKANAQHHRHESVPIAVGDRT